MNQSLEVLLNGMQFRKLMESEFEAIYKEYNLCKIDLQILYYLYTAGEHNTSKDIFDLELFSKGHISQSLSRLQKMKLIIMVQDEDDRRYVHNVLTQDANKVLAGLQEVYARINRVVLKDVTEEEKRTLVSLAQRINDNIRNELSER